MAHHKKGKGNDAFEIARPRASDAARIAEIHLVAMADNPLLHAQFPTPESREGLRQMLERVTAEELGSIPGSGSCESGSGGSVRGVGAGDGAGVGAEVRHAEGEEGAGKGGGVLIARDRETGVVAAFVKWDHDLPAHSSSSGEEGEKKKLESSDGLRNIEGCRPEFLEGYVQLAEAAKERCFGGRECYRLSFVCTDPAYQGRGAGSLLTRRVMDMAAADGLPVYLESTEVAVPMYKRVGFQVLDGFELMIPRPGSDELGLVYRELCMIWYPPSGGDGKSSYEKGGE